MGSVSGFVDVALCHRLLWWSTCLQTKGEGEKKKETKTDRVAEALRR